MIVFAPIIIHSSIPLWRMPHSYLVCLGGSAVSLGRRSGWHSPASGHGSPHGRSWVPVGPCSHQPAWRSQRNQTLYRNRALGSQTYVNRRTSRQADRQRLNLTWWRWERCGAPQSISHGEHSHCSRHPWWHGCPRWPAILLVWWESPGKTLPRCTGTLWCWSAALCDHPLAFEEKCGGDGK